MEMIKILFVDDEILAMEYLQNMIEWEKHGFQVTGHARSGKKALELYEKEKPQVVISDIKMAGMDGLELTQKLKELNPEIEVILLSAYKDFEYAKKGFEYGVSNYLLKHELCEEKLLQELEKVRGKIKSVEQKSRIYQKYFMEQLIFNPENAKLMDSDDFGNSFFMVLIHKNEVFEDGRFQVKEWSGTELKILKQIMEEPEADITYLADIQLTGNNILALYSLVNISSRYQISSRIEQKSRLISSYLSMVEKCQYNIIFSEEIGREEICSMFQRMSAQVRYAVFWKNRCIYGMNRLREPRENERISWNEYEEELRGLIRDGGEQTKDYVRYLFEMVKFPENNLPSLKELIYLLENLVREFEKREGITWQGKRGEICKVDDICHLYMERIHFICQKISENQNGSYSKLVVEMIRYIRQHYEQELNLEQMGELFHMNGVYLGQIFKKETGITFLKYLTNYRVEEAKRLLLQGEMNVSQVAEAVGYKTSQYFSQIFVKITGIKPQEYRKWNGKIKEKEI